MKKPLVLLFCAAVLLTATSSITIRSSNGIAGYTGAPGSFGTCNNCHGGGSSQGSGITISAAPSFTNNEYMPDSVYQITVSAIAPGFSRFGFDCEILTPQNTNAGVISPNFAGGVKTLVAAGRVNAVHTVPQVTATPAFTFPWKAPATGTAIVYAIVNAVNGNGNTGGDFPLTPVSLTLTPKAPESKDSAVTGIADLGNRFGHALFPNPAFEVVTIQTNGLSQAEVEVEIMNVYGAVCAREQAVVAKNGCLTVKVSQLKPGHYILQVKGAGGSIDTHRFWKF